MEEQAALQAAIEKTYTIFERYPLHHPVIGCPCCISKADQERLASRPLRLLDAFDLDRFIWKTMSTWGDENDFKHFLPRMLELVTDPHERRGLPAHLILFGKLSYCKAWTEAEWEAVTDYLLAFWHWILADHPGDENDTLEAYDFLDALSYGIDDLTPFLHTWHTIHTPSSLRQLANLVRNHSWGSRLAKHKQLRAWLREDRTREILEEGFYAHMDEDWTEELALAVEVLEWLRAA